MVNDEKHVITAIRDMSQEGFIAASLKRSGWEVVYRATSIAALKEKLSDFPQALLLVSDDFGDVSGLQLTRSIQLRGRSHPLSASSTFDPQSDFELAEFIRAREANTSRSHISATSARVIGISSLGGRTGATTIAIALADRLSRSGHSLLLVDGNRIHPRIAQHFQIHNIRGAISQTAYGFSLCESTDIQGLNLLAQEANNFEFIVVDLGTTSLAVSGGARVEDLLHAWTLNSRAQKIISLRDDERSNAQLHRYLEEQMRQPNREQTTIFLTPSKILGRRERKKLTEEREQLYGSPVVVVSRDIRSVEKMEGSHTTLNVSAPQSPITGDIARYLDRERYS